MVRIADHLTQSKHPMSLNRSNGVGRSSYRDCPDSTKTEPRERPSAFNTMVAGKESFDCMVDRFANDNFAQDDSHEKYTTTYRFFVGGTAAATIGLLTGTIAPFEGSAAACARVSTSS